MSPASAAARIADLRRRIDDADHRYYMLDAPDIPDAEYDRLMRELEALEAAHPDLRDPNSPTARVGGVPSGKFGQVDHAVPMLSLAHAFTDDEVRAFVSRITRETGDAEPAFVPGSQGECPVVCVGDALHDCQAEADTCVVGAYAFGAA